MGRQSAKPRAFRDSTRPPKRDDVGKLADGAGFRSGDVQQEIEAAEARLGNAGRLVISASDTEAVIRVMAEGENEHLLKTVIEDVCRSILAHGKSQGQEI
jgi:phosphomannomutase